MFLFLILKSKLIISFIPFPSFFKLSPSFLFHHHCSCFLIMKFEFHRLIINKHPSYFSHTPKLFTTHHHSPPINFLHIKYTISFTFLQWYSAVVNYIFSGEKFLLFNFSSINLTNFTFFNFIYKLFQIHIKENFTCMKTNFPLDKILSLLKTNSNRAFFTSVLIFRASSSCIEVLSFLPKVIKEFILIPKVWQIFFSSIYLSLNMISYLIFITVYIFLINGGG